MAKKQLVKKMPVKVDIAKGSDSKSAQYIMDRINESRGYLEENYYPKWKVLDNLYKGIREKSAYTSDWQSNMSSNILFGIVQQELSMLMTALYPKSDFFSFETEEDSEKAEKSVEVYKKIMEIQAKDMHLYRNMSWSVLDSLIYSLGWLKVEWEFDEVKKQYLDFSSGKIIPVEEVDKIDRPMIRNVSPFNVFFDRNATSMSDCKWIAESITLTKKDIMSDIYNAPSKKELMYDLADKDEDYIVNCFVYYTTDSITVITDGGVIIRKHHTLYKHNKLPWFALVKFPLQRTLLGLSTCEMVSDSVKYHDQLINTYADNLSMAIHQLWLLKSSSTLEQKDLRVFPGKVLQVRNLDELSKVPNQAPIQPYNELASINSTINKVLGNMDQVDDNSNRTATEARISAQRSNIKQQSYIMYNREEAIKPILAMWFDLNQQFMTKEKVAKLLGKKEAKALSVESEKIDLNVSAKVIISGEAGLVDKTQQLENLSTFINLMGAITQMPPEIDKGKLIGLTLANIDLPEDIYKEELVQEEVPQGQAMPQDAPVTAQEGNQEAIMSEISQASSQVNMTPDKLIMSIAVKVNMTPEQVIQQIEAMGSLNAFLESVKGGKV